MLLPRRPKRCGEPRPRVRSAVAVPVFTSGTCNFGKEKHSALRVLRTRWRTKAKYAVLMTSCTQPFARDRGADCVISADRGPVPSRDRAGKSRAVHRVEGGSSQQSRVGQRAGDGRQAGAAIDCAWDGDGADATAASLTPVPMHGPLAYVPMLPLRPVADSDRHAARDRP
jgi:hypothetical protein